MDLRKELILMRTRHRVIAATAVGLPLLLAGSGMVMAKNSHKPHKPHKVDQQISRTSTDGSNTVTQITRRNGGAFQQVQVSSQDTTNDDD
jgi:hypothetical protein